MEYAAITEGVAQIRADQARALAASHFAVVCEGARELTGECDRNFLMTTEQGEQFVLKVANAHAHRRDLELQNRILDHLGGCELSFRVPRVMRSRFGDEVVTVQVGDVGHLARLVSWVPGTPVAEVCHHSPELLRELGSAAAELSNALANFSHPLASRSHHWDLRRSVEAIESCIEFVDDPKLRRSIERSVDAAGRGAVGALADLPQTVIHQDLSDNNLLSAIGADRRRHVCGVLDVGDALLGAQVADLAILVAYAILRKSEPIAAARHIVTGFHRCAPLLEPEVALVFPLVLLRLAVCAATWSRRHAEHRNTAYAGGRAAQCSATLQLLQDVDPVYAEAMLRAACELEPFPGTPALRAWISRAERSSFVEPPLPNDPVDLRPGSDISLGEISDLRGIAPHGHAHYTRSGRRIEGADEPRTIHLGIDLFCAAGTHIRVPLAGVATMASDQATILVRHCPPGGPPFWTCYSGLRCCRELPAEFEAGDVLGAVDERGDANWLPPHAHVQIACSLRGDLPPPTHARPSEADVWMSLCPDPAMLLIPSPSKPTPEALRRTDVLRLRAAYIGRSQRSYYEEPPNLVQGLDVWLTDEDGLQYLDALNNVTHVGHGHPAVVAASHAQTRRLNTNSRFLYEGLARYAQRLAGLLPDPLDVVFFCCTGSEANDLALRMARTYTGRSDVVVIDGAYHGNTTAVTAISPNRYQGAGGAGRPPGTHEVPKPDRYRGPFGYADPDAGREYSKLAAAVVDDLVENGTPPAAMFAESLMGTAGQIVLPEGYLAPVFESVRAAGGVCVADEVQVGFGRLGRTFWGFQTQGVTPDIVTMGKPMGNGHPMSAVVTTHAIADAFDNGMRYFNTFAGNPVSCAVGEAVLDVIEHQALQDNAKEVGSYLLERFHDLQQRHSCVGDVRGVGLYIGVELVRDRETKEPATEEAYRVCERLKDTGVLLYPNGPFENILKVKPPMTFSCRHADILADSLDLILREGW